MPVSHHSKWPALLIDACASTMDAAKYLAQTPLHQKASFFVVTRKQTKGRGRFGRTWSQGHIKGDPSILKTQPSAPSLSQFAQFDSLTQVYQKKEPDFFPLTLALSKKDLMIPLEWVPLLVGVALYDAFLTLYQTCRKKKKQTKNSWQLFLKWPNDLIWNTDGHFEKIAGILCEAQKPSHTDISHIFIGIGINFFRYPELDNTASIFQKMETSERNKQAILQKFAEILEYSLYKYLCHFHTESKIKNFVLKRSFPIGTIISVNNRTKTGHFQGLNEHGALILKPLNSSEQEPNEIIYSAENIDIVSSKKNIKQTSQDGLISLDFGNTRIHITVKRNLNLKKQKNTHIFYDDLTPKKITKQFASNVKILSSDKIKRIFIYYVSVNSKIITKQSLKKILNYLKKQFPKKTFQTFEITEKDLFEFYRMPKILDERTLGTDRALKCIFAFQRSQRTNKNVLIVSFGTAITCEGFSPNGTMIENFVSPGLQMSFDALHHFTALLPRLDIKKANFFQSTKYWTQKNYLERGVYLNALSTVFLAAKLHEPCQIILTGGNATDVYKIISHIPDENFITRCDLQIIPNIETTMLSEYAMNACCLNNL